MVDSSTLIKFAEALCELAPETTVALKDIAPVFVPSDYKNVEDDAMLVEKTFANSSRIVIRTLPF